MTTLNEISKKYMALDCAVAKGIYCTIDGANIEDLPTEGTVILYKVGLINRVKPGSKLFYTFQGLNKVLNPFETYERVEISAEILKYYRITVPFDIEKRLLNDSNVSILKKFISWDYQIKHLGWNEGFSLAV